MSRFFTEEHEWIEFSDNTATIGITKHAADELGEVVYVELPSIDDNFEKGDEFGSVESVKTVSGIYSPASGTVVGLNDSLESSPELLNSDPEGDAWLIKLAVSDQSVTESLMNESEYKAYIS